MSDELFTRGAPVKGLVDGTCLPDDNEPEFNTLRPQCLEDYIGQREVVETLKIAIQAALLRKEPLEHILFHGPPGLGKTTLAHIIAVEMGGRLTVTSGPALEKGGDLIGILTHLEAGDILFIDEIHRMTKAVEEFLYPAMEDFAVDFVFDKGIHARSHRYRLNRFTLVGATTRVGLLSAPLRDRFGLFRSLDFYATEDLVDIINRSALILEIPSMKRPQPVCATLARHASNCQPLPEACTGLCPGSRRRSCPYRACGSCIALEGVDERGLQAWIAVI
jgi:holliday junction DNA helicase RuvB